MKNTLADIIDILTISAVSILVLIAGVSGVIKSYDVTVAVLVSALGIVVTWGIGGMIADDIRRNKRNK